MRHAFGTSPAAVIAGSGSIYKALRIRSNPQFVQDFDGFGLAAFVTPEYNHSISGALKNAIDFLFGEWNNKAAGFVSYGGAGGARAVE